MRLWHLHAIQSSNKNIAIMLCKLLYRKFYKTVNPDKISLFSISALIVGRSFSSLQKKWGCEKKPFVLYHVRSPPNYRIIVFLETVYFMTGAISKEHLFEQWYWTSHWRSKYLFEITRLVKVVWLVVRVLQMSRPLSSR